MHLINSLCITQYLAVKILKLQHDVFREKKKNKVLIPSIFLWAIILSIKHYCLHPTIATYCLYCSWIQNMYLQVLLRFQIKLITLFLVFYLKNWWFWCNSNDLDLFKASNCTFQVIYVHQEYSNHLTLSQMIYG